MWYLTPFHFPTSFMEEEKDNGIGCNIVRNEGRFNPTIFRPWPWKMKRRACSRWRGAAMVSLLGSYACSSPSHHQHLHYRSLPLPSLLRLLSSSPHNNVHRRLRRGCAAAATASLVCDELVRSNSLKRRSLWLVGASAFAFPQLKAGASEEAVPGA